MTRTTNGLIFALAWFTACFGVSCSTSSPTASPPGTNLFVVTNPVTRATVAIPPPPLPQFVIVSNRPPYTNKPQTNLPPTGEIIEADLPFQPNTVWAMQSSSNLLTWKTLVLWTNGATLTATSPFYWNLYSTNGPQYYYRVLATNFFSSTGPAQFYRVSRQ